MSDHYRLYGALGSPYSVKMRAAMRYKRLPFVWVGGRAAHELATTKMKAPVIPVLEWPDGSLHNDSTPMLAALDARHPQRALLPEDPGEAFLALLLEDFADEWLTKAMFHYRWFLPRDQARMSRWLAFDAFQGGGEANVEAFAAAFAERQIGRMAIVGCTPENRALIEGVTRDALAALDRHVLTSHFLFGSRPSVAEFAIFGQISQLGTDPTAQEMMRADFPYAYRWLAHAEDWSGVEGAWRDPEAAPTEAVQALLRLTGEIYLPFLEANAAALARGAPWVELTLRGAPYRQAPFKYQAKCLAELRRGFAALPQGPRARISKALAEAGCLETLERQD